MTLIRIPIFPMKLNFVYVYLPSTFSFSMISPLVFSLILPLFFLTSY